MKENYIHKLDIFIETTASYMSWLSYDLERYLKDHETDHDFLIKNIAKIEERKALLRKLNSYIVDLDIQTHDENLYKKIDLTVRYGKACGLRALDKPFINNFSQDVRDTIAQEDLEFANKYSNYLSTLLTTNDPGYIYLKLSKLLEEGLHMLEPVIEEQGLAKKRALRKFTLHLENTFEYLETQLQTKVFQEFLQEECRSIDDFDQNKNNEKFLDHIIYLWSQMYCLYLNFLQELIQYGKKYDEGSIFSALNNLKDIDTHTLMIALDINRAYLYIIGYGVKKYEVLSAPDELNISTHRMPSFNLEINSLEEKHEQSKSEK